VRDEAKTMMQKKLWTSGPDDPPHHLVDMSDALEQGVGACTAMVAVFADASCEKLLGRGTGTCIQIGGRYLVATAAHIFEKTPATYQAAVVCLTESGSTIWPTSWPRIRGGADELVDVAFLELESAVATTTGRSFIQVRTLDPFYQEAASDLAFVYGYPWPVEMLEKGATGRDRFGLVTVADMTGFLVTSSQQENEPFDLRVRYTRPLERGAPPPGRVHRLPDPRGLSGGAVWAMTGAGQDARLRVVGTVRAWCETEHWLQCDRIGHWMQFVADERPDVRLEIEGILTGAMA
jgi:hypothetical protein